MVVPARLDKTGFQDLEGTTMELRHLRYFVAVAEALSFTKAAQNLRLAQPSLTRQIKDFEAEIGVRFFDRSGKRISLTQEGESFVLDAKRLLADCANSVQAVQRLSQGRTEQLNIGYVANVYHDLLPAKLGGIPQSLSSDSAQSVRHDARRAIPRPQ